MASPRHPLARLQRLDRHAKDHAALVEAELGLAAPLGIGGRPPSAAQPILGLVNGNY